MGVADQIVGDADVAEIAAPSDHDAISRRTLDDIVANDAIRFDGDANTARVDILAEEEIADEIALDDGEPAALFEIGHADSHRRLVYQIVGNQRALEGELGIERDLAETGAGIADHLAVRASVRTDRGEGACGEWVI